MKTGSKDKIIKGIGMIKMKDQYCYPVIFEYAEDGVNISFPDLPGALICGDTTEEALEMAKECLEK